MGKILITGVAGFIGANLGEYLLEQGHEVVGVDNLSVGTMANLSEMLRYKNFSFYKGDVLDSELLQGLMTRVDTVYHLAATKIPRYGGRVETLKINGLASFYLLENACKMGKRVIAASTSDVYGKNSNFPFSESDDSVIGNPLVGRWSYAISKMFEEQSLIGFWELYRNPVFLVRFFGAYGPKHTLDWRGGPISVFLSNAINNKPLEIHGDGKQSRTFSFINDHIRGLSKLLNLETDSPQIMNFGSSEEITIQELANLVWRLVHPEEGRIPQIRMIAYSEFGKYEDVRRRIPKMELTKSLVGNLWNTPLHSGLQQTLAWHKSQVGTA